MASLLAKRHQINPPKFKALVVILVDAMVNNFAKQDGM
jgi:hypothetical protein